MAQRADVLSPADPDTFKPDTEEALTDATEEVAGTESDAQANAFGTAAGAAADAVADKLIGAAGAELPKADASNGAREDDAGAAAVLTDERDPNGYKNENRAGRAGDSPVFFFNTGPWYIHHTARQLLHYKLDKLDAPTPIDARHSGQRNYIRRSQRAPDSARHPRCRCLRRPAPRHGSELHFVRQPYRKKN